MPTAQSEKGLSQKAEDYCYQRQEGVGPDRVAELRAMQEEGLLGDYCTLLAFGLADSLARMLYDRGICLVRQDSSQTQPG